ncbi:MAG: nucleotide sugar dehydrogenase [Nitrosopumilus sp.]|nr:nucleotide sugar dehydrogenase [Nitrosopumilus sp.]
MTLLKDKKREDPISNNSSNLESPESITKKIKTGEYSVAVYGLGHVGAPIASSWLRSGVTVIGIDKSQKVVENAKKGLTHIPEPGVNEAFSEGIRNGKFLVYEDPIKASVDSKLKMICVPVLIKNKTADLSAVKEVALAISKGLKPHDIVSLHPTVPPLTTEKFLIPLLEKASRLKAGRDFFVVYNPERIYEGRAIFDIEEGHPGIVAGIEKHSLELAENIFSLIFRKGVIKISSIKTAEAEKLFEGVYRDVNIALANEMSVLCEKLGIDFWEAKDAANSQPFCHIHNPGIGVGGACIPVYPQFILDVATKNKVECKITKASRAINDNMPTYALSKALKMISKKDIKKAKITILGLSFRGGVSDTRLSPTYSLIKKLSQLKIPNIIIHDPIANDEMLIAKNKTIKITNDLDFSIKNRDLIILATDHTEYSTLSKEKTGKTPIYDGRGILNPNSFDAGSFKGIGR